MFSGSRFLPSLHANNSGMEVRTVNASAWYSLFLATVATFIAFLLLDPEPNLILATSAAANVAILLWAIFRLYVFDLLLSPAAAAVIGPGWLIHYSWGNLGARIAGEGRFGSNYGSLDFYPQAALLTTVGLVLFCIVVFGVFSRQIKHTRIRYQDLVWRPWQVIASTMITLAILGYLSSKYLFLSVYFRGIENDFDRILAPMSLNFVTLTNTISVSVVVNKSGWRGKIIGIMGLLFMLTITLGLRSRTFMLLSVVNIGLCWIVLRPYRVKKVLVVGLLSVGLMFSLGTAIKSVSMQGETASILDNLAVLQGLDTNTIETNNDLSIQIDSQYRVAGFEYPATLIMILSAGRDPMYGQGVVGGFWQVMPSFLRPSTVISSERQAIAQHFSKYGLTYSDSIGVPLTSGLADWGILFCVFIYLAIGIYCLVLWKIVQSSPRLFVAYLMVGIGTGIALRGVGDLFWENVFSFFKQMAFAWLTLTVFSFAFMPQWKPEGCEVPPK